MQYERHLVKIDGIGGGCDVVTVEVDALCVLQSLRHGHGALALHAHPVLSHNYLLRLVPAQGSSLSSYGSTKHAWPCELHARSIS